MAGRTDSGDPSDPFEIMCWESIEADLTAASGMLGRGEQDPEALSQRFMSIHVKLQLLALRREEQEFRKRALNSWMRMYVPQTVPLFEYMANTVAEFLPAFLTVANPDPVQQAALVVSMRRAFGMAMNGLHLAEEQATRKALEHAPAAAAVQLSAEGASGRAAANF